MSRIRDLKMDTGYLLSTLKTLLNIPSPTGMTDLAVGFVCSELTKLEIPHELTRRGAIRANLPGERASPDRSVSTHLDTLGAIVKRIKPSGRLEIAPVGHWSARFAEGARVTVFMDEARKLRGTILPLKASGHTYGDDVDALPVSWSNVEVRLDERIENAQDAMAVGVNVGDLIAIDSTPQFEGNGFINARHLDDKAGVAAVLTAAKAIRENGVSVPLNCHLLFTISEEVGVGASHILHGEVAEMLSVDNGTIAPEQNTSEYGVTVAMQDSSGPFDWHLTRSLLHLCQRFNIEHSRDVFNHYRSDAASAMEAGNDMRAALVCFALDASHGYERTHIDSLIALSRLVNVYMQSPRLFERDEDALGPIGDLPASEYDRIDEPEPAFSLETSGAAHGPIPAHEPTPMHDAPAQPHDAADAASAPDHHAPAASRSGSGPRLD
jgi:peptidase M42 family hydrolase